MDQLNENETVDERLALLLSHACELRSDDELKTWFFNLPVYDQQLLSLYAPGRQANIVKATQELMVALEKYFSPICELIRPVADAFEAIGKTWRDTNDHTE